MSPKIAVVHTAIQPEERHCTGAHLTTSPEIPVHDFLANIPLLRDASPEEIERMAAGTRRVYAQKGEALFRRGDPCEGFWIVLYGQIKLLVTSPQGMEKVIEIVGPGLTFGESLTVDLQHHRDSQPCAVMGRFRLPRRRLLPTQPGSVRFMGAVTSPRVGLCILPEFRWTEAAPK